MKQNKIHSAVDIVVPVYNGYEDLVLCIESIRKHTDLSRHRVLLIDDLSTDSRVRDLISQVCAAPPDAEQGMIALFNEKNVGTNEKYSISKEKQGLSLFISPSIGVKMHITQNIGVLASVSDEAYLVNAFETSRNDYRRKLIHSFGINLGVCFQIRGW